MRVLHIGLSKNPGGIETFIMTYFRKLVHKDIVFDFIDIYGDGLAFAGEIEFLGGKVFTVSNYKKHPIKAKKEMISIIKENKYKIVHINMLSAANILPLLAVKNTGAIAVVHAHNDRTQGLLRTLMHSLNLTALRKNSDIKLACSVEAGKWLWGKGIFSVIPNAIDADNFSFSMNDRVLSRRSLGISDSDFVIGFVGRLSTQKNPLYLIDIFYAVKQQTHRNVKLLLIGDGPLKNSVMSYAKDKGVINDTIFAGIQSNTSQWYSVFDCFVLPSLYEGFGIVAVEAQANGLPCFVSAHVPPAIKIADSLRFLPLDNGANNWADAIVSVADNDAVERNNNIKGTQYDSEVSVTELSDVYLYAEKL